MGSYSILSHCNGTKLKANSRNNYENGRVNRIVLNETEEKRVFFSFMDLNYGNNTDESVGYLK